MAGITYLFLIIFSFSSFAFNQRNSLMFQEELEPESLHPLNIEGYDSQAMLQQYVIEPLALRNEETYEWEPLLASSWEIDEEKNTYTFTLREGVTWSDGRPLTAEDVKYSFDILFDTKYRTFHSKPYYENLSKVEILSPYKIRFHAKDSSFLNFHCAAGLTIVPKHIYDPKVSPIDQNRNIIGSGPYKLSKWSHGKFLHLQKNESWWGLKVPELKEKYKVENVVFRFVNKPFMALEMLKKGSLDYMKLDFNLYQKSAMGSKGFFPHKVENSTPKSVPYMGFNLNNPVLKEIAVRKALSLLVDRPTMLEKFFHNQYKAASGPWYSESPYAPPEMRDHVDEYSPEKAYTLLKENGWKDSNEDGVLEKNGKKLEFTVIYGDDSPIPILSMLQLDARKAGIDMKMKRIEWSVINQKLKSGEFDALYTDWGPGPVDFDPRNSWHSEATYEKGGLNFMRYKNKRVDELIESMLITADQEKRKSMYHEAYRLIREDQPALFFYYPRFEYYAVSPRVGQSASTMKYDLGRKYWWIKQTELGAAK